METYRVINRELSLNNQELRNALNKLKHEVTYLNRQLLDQREQFNRLKESIANTIEKKYNETMALIYPERISQTKSPTQIYVRSHRRSCHNVIAADKLKNRTTSPPAKSPSPMRDLMVDINLKTPVPKIVVQRDVRIGQSPFKFLKNISDHTNSLSICEKHSQNMSGNYLQTISGNNLESISGNKSQIISGNQSQNISGNQSQSTSRNNSQDSLDFQQSKQHSQNNSNYVGLDLSQSFISLSNSLRTINEELSTSSDVDMRNETLTDATINNLLDAPCSTPYNPTRVGDRPITLTKEMRVLVHKMSLQQMQQLRMASSVRIFSESNATDCNNTDYIISRKEDNTLNLSSNYSKGAKTTAIKCRTETAKNIPKNNVKEKSIKKKTSTKRSQNSFKENNRSESEFTCSDEESNGKYLRSKRKAVKSMKEPSLRQKLRNTTNIKLK